MTQTTLREYLRTTEDAISSGRIEEAMANCQNILTFFPEALEAQRLLGEVYLAQGHLEEAQQTFEWILTNDPENVIVYCDRALISERSADIDTALDCYQQAYELSRGNADIRQEFNQLSAKAGQQEFMFSRAGLARLYMRGDLLTQAIQEWEAVLAISPDRLDARLGLMETYWRDGLYDKAESIATQLLEEIPTCLKALLYLAHITSIASVQRARELLQRAEALDPDLRMAQEIFADLNASQPNDPFLELIKREPLLLNNGIPVSKPIVNAPAVVAPANQNSQPAPLANPSASSYGSWDQQQPASANINQEIPETPLRPNWSAGLESASPANQAAPALPDWQTQIGNAAPNEQPWYQQDQFSTAKADPMKMWESLEPEAPEAEPAPPAWLDTLTKSEQRPPIEQPRPAQPPVPPVVPEVRATLPSAPAPVASEDEQPFFFPPEEGENEGETSWPEWLKSLGAAALEPEQPVSAGQLSPAAQVPAWDLSQQPTPRQNTSEADPWAEIPVLSANNDGRGKPDAQPNWMQQLEPSPAQAQASTPDWMQQLSTAEILPAQAAQAAAPEWMQQVPPAQPQVPDWMQQMSANQSSQDDEQDYWMKQVPPTEPAPVQTNAPDWMQQIAPAQPSQAATPDWMQQIAPAQPSQPATPDWMQQMSPAQPVQSARPDWMQQMSPAQPPAQSATPDWMQQMSPAQPPAQSATPDWMQQMSPAQPAAPAWMQQHSPIEHSPAQSATPDWMQQFTSTRPQDPFQQSSPASWMQQIAGASNVAPSGAAEQEQQYIASLADLEKNLQAEGFVPLAPGALASIAQTQNIPPVPMQQPQQYEEPSVSSALAQLSNFSQGNPVTTSNEPWWNSTLSQQQSASSANPFAVLGARTTDEAALGALPATPVPVQSSQSFMPGYAPEPVIEETLTPTYRSDALLDSDLETTMKRPAIKLQPMQPVTEQSDRTYATGKNRVPEHKSAEGVEEANLGSRERLVRGYQSQLAGAYDDAMQDYRLIIRNAPELLDDVISNMRALLKLNPRFSLGYRVLGDAYMRKGEYLQAMESYNKALTMAKKSRN